MPNKAKVRTECPLKYYADAEGIRCVPCSEEECAWWDSEQKQCVIKTLAEMFGVVSLGG